MERSMYEDGLVAVDGLDPDHVIVLRFKEGLQRWARWSGANADPKVKLVFTQDQWRHFLQALPGLRVILMSPTTDQEITHQEIKGGGLILEYTMDLSLPVAYQDPHSDPTADPPVLLWMPQDARVFENLYRAVLCSVTENTLNHSSHDDSDPRGSDLANVDAWLGYLRPPRQTVSMTSDRARRRLHDRKFSGNPPEISGNF